MSDEPTLLLRFRFHPSSGMFVAQVEGSEEVAFTMSPVHIHGNLSHRLAALADDTRAAAGTWIEPKRRTPPPIKYEESQVRRFKGNSQVIVLDDLDLEIDL